MNILPHGFEALACPSDSSIPVETTDTGKYAATLQGAGASISTDGFSSEGYAGESPPLLEALVRLSAVPEPV